MGFAHAQSLLRLDAAFFADTFLKPSVMPSSAEKFESPADASPSSVALSPQEAEIVADLNHALAIGALDRAISLLGELAKRRGVAQIAQKAGLNRTHVYHAFAEGGNPSLDILMRICEAMRLKVQIVPTDADEAQRPS